MPRRFRTATEFQEPGKCFELFPGEFSMTRHGGGLPGLAVDVKAMLPSFSHELAALTLKMPN